MAFIGTDDPANAATAGTALFTVNDLFFSLLDDADGFSRKAGVSPRQALLDAMTAFYAWKKKHFETEADIDRIVAVESCSNAYEVVLYRFFQQGPRPSPLAFVLSLGAPSLKALQVIHELPQDFAWSHLDEDSALRLILPKSTTWKPLPHPAPYRAGTTQAETYPTARKRTPFPPAGASSDIVIIWQNVTGTMGMADRILLEHALGAVKPAGQNSFSDYHETGLRALALQIHRKENDDPAHGPVHRRVIDAILSFFRALPSRNQSRALRGI